MVLNYPLFMFTYMLSVRCMFACPYVHMIILIFDFSYLLLFTIDEGKLMSGKKISEAKKTSLFLSPYFPVSLKSHLLNHGNINSSCCKVKVCKFLLLRISWNPMEMFLSQLFDLVPLVPAFNLQKTQKRFSDFGASVEYFPMPL